MTRVAAYPEYKASGTKWLGAVPKHWKISPLGQHFRERKGIVSDADFAALSVTKQGIVPQLETAAKTDNGDSRKLVLTGDFAINSRSDRKGSSGVSPFNGSVSLITTVITPIGLEAKYVHHLLRSEPFQEEYYRFGNGIVADLWSTRYAQMKSISLAVPPLVEQRQIAEYLDRETGQIDALITKQEQLVETLAERRQAVITHAVTRGLDPRVDFKDSGIAAIGRIPGLWQVKKLSYLFSTIGSGTTPAAEGTDFYDGDMPWVTTGELRESVILTTRKAVSESALRTLSALKVFPAGSLVLAMYGATIGRLGILGVDATTNQACCVLAEPRGVNVDFAYFSLQVATERLLNMASGGGQPNINQDVVRQFRIAVPSLAEQSEIVRHLTIEASRIDNLVVKARQVVEVLKERRQALISAAVTGKIDVRGL
ncbi:restriction endonuclease subunit S [Cryobacterium sp. 1639]|uniref:restriction endonuclease subunit S n=1 Tax=Cryobacterium inferilacus TaxID=2866629 RepID=UPI001C73646D|nr:restriction endonuclease subunit S [Cryobacterium sp. 1639]MBX0299379.1 restriction endonuclease subunit S [Cryobacterium sp. 1639]